MIDVYPVGWLAFTKHFYGAIRQRQFTYARRRLKHELQMNWEWAREGKWRVIRLGFNGYLAEPTPFPDHMKRCGSGWTKRRALRSLERHGYPAA